MYPVNKLACKVLFDDRMQPTLGTVMTDYRDNEDLRMCHLHKSCEISFIVHVVAGGGQGNGFSEIEVH